MKPIDYENLVKAYCSAWQAVKGGKCTMTIEPNGWFTRTLYNPARHQSMRTSELMQGLADLTSQLPAKYL